MSRLIDADALMMDLEKWMKQVDPTHPQEDNAIPPLEDIIVSTLMTIEEQPTVDAVCVVRCKDCKHWDGVPADETQDHECHLFDGNEEKIRIATPSYWFCPMGERRSE